MNLFDLAAVITLDSSGYERGLENTEGKTKSFAGKLGGLLKGVGKAAGALLGVGAAGLTAGATAASGLIKSATDAYATYEQLIGGTELLFGEAYDFVREKAKTAYKDVQMSQNDYLQQVNGFAVGLKTSLEGNEQAAAELAAKIVEAEADVVAATGNSQEAVQNAFNGIMKGNYTMLDNLQLGIKPTKEGFQEVIDKVNEWNKAQGNATEYTIDNLADAQSALVDYIEMQGLAGYAANEAADTIEGSAAAARAAWENVKIAIASGEDLAGSVSSFVSSAKDYVNNLLPVIKTAASGLGTMIRELAPVIAKEIPPLVKEILPALLTAASSIIGALLDAFESLIDPLLGVIFDNLDQFIDAAFQIVDALARGILENLDRLFDAALQIVGLLVGKLIEVISATDWVEVGRNIVQFIANIDWAGLFKQLASLSGGLSALPVVLIEMLMGAFQEMFSGLGEWMYGTFGDFADLTWQGFLDGLLKALGDIGSWMMDNVVDPLVKSFADALGLDGDAAVQAMHEWVTNTMDVFLRQVDAAVEWGANLVNNVKTGFSNAWNGVKTFFTNTFNSITDIVKKPFDKAKDIVKNAIDFIKGLFKFEWSLPKLKLPHFSIGTGVSVLGIDLPKINVEWYKKAYENPYLFDRPTVVHTAGGLKGFGDGNGDEMVYGRESLMRDIREAVGMPVVKLYIDRDRLVGGTADVMDSTLGNMQELKLRWEGA